MNIEFIKLNLGESSYTLISNLPDENPLLCQKIAQRINDPVSGAASDGSIFLQLSKEKASCLFFTPKGEKSPPPYDAILTLSRYLYDTALLGVEDIILKTDDGPVLIEPLDGKTFRINVPFIFNDQTKDLQDILKPDIYTHRVLVQGKPRIIMELNIGTSYQLYYTEESSSADIKMITKVLKKRKRDAVIILIKVISPERLDIKIPDIHPHLDQSKAAATALIASIMNGFISQEALVMLPSKNPVFLELKPKDKKITISATPDYAFSGKIWINTEKEDENESNFR